MEGTVLLTGGGLAFGYLAVKDFIWPAILKQRNGNGNGRSPQARMGDLPPEHFELMMRTAIREEMKMVVDRQNELLTNIRDGIGTLISQRR